jgi:hypothetical protein
MTKMMYALSEDNKKRKLLDLRLISVGPGGEQARQQLRLFDRQGNYKCCAHSWSTLCCNASSVPFDNLFAYGKSHAGSFVFAATMQSLERGENLSEVLLLETNAVILDNDLTSFFRDPKAFENADNGKTIYCISFWPDLFWGAGFGHKFFLSFGKISFSSKLLYPIIMAQKAGSPCNQRSFGRLEACLEVIQQEVRAPPCSCLDQYMGY